jgi:hypothetical protein
MASLQTVYGEFAQDTATMNPFQNNIGTDSTPMAVGLMVLFWGAVLFLLKKYGFRFNFGVASR